MHFRSTFNSYLPTLPQIGLQKGRGLCKFRPKMGAFLGGTGEFPGAGLQSPGFGDKKVGKHNLIHSKF